MKLIKSANIIDGSGRPAYKADVLLRDAAIAAIGTFPNKKADEVIDGLGLYLAPGFIDLNTDADHYLGLFLNPEQNDFLLQGVTTIIGGHCGASLAPLIYGSLESIRKWGNPNSINVGWHTMREFFDVVGRLKLGVNFGTLVGHSTIRRALIGEDFRDLTVRELEVFQKMVRDALAEGALGFSTGLGYAHARGTPYAELRALLQVVAKEKGMYATHLRDDGEGLMASIDETTRLARESGVPTLINHLKPLLGREADFSTAVAAISDASRGGALYFSLYPFDTSVVALYTLLPEWARVGNLEKMLSVIKAKETREQILREWNEKTWGEIRIAGVGSTGELAHLLGKTIKEFGAANTVPHNEALLRLMELTGLRATVFYKNVDLDIAEKALMGPRAFVASNSGGLNDDKRMIKHERFVRTFPRFLEVALRRKELSLEAAIHKITSAPAELLGLRGRGVIKEGAAADLVLFSVQGESVLTIQHVLVNGKNAVRNGVVENARAGTALRRRS